MAINFAKLDKVHMLLASEVTIINIKEALNAILMEHHLAWKSYAGRKCPSPTWK